MLTKSKIGGVRKTRQIFASFVIFFGISIFFFPVVAGKQDHHFNIFDWKTNFANTSIDLQEIIQGGPEKDNISSLDKPKFVPATKIKDLADTEPLLSLNINGDVRGYPLRVLIWHQIVNDVVGGVPVVITYCPLSNSAIVFERTLGGEVISFGVTGLVRHSNMVMYDWGGESWWQQFLGESIVGVRSGQQLKKIVSHVESFALLQARSPQSRILIPNKPKNQFYGKNPYVKYDTSKTPFLYKGVYKGNLPPLAYVVVVGDQAWPLQVLRERGEIIYKDITISFTAGQNSALDHSFIAKGRDIGNVRVQRNGKDLSHQIIFSFVYDAFISQK